MALPLPPLRRQGLRRDLGHLAQVMHDYRVRAVVVGLPLNMDGTQGPRAQAVRAFISTWLADCAQQEGGGGALIITLQDERLSTAEADEAACGLGLRDARRTEALDSLAAVAILERALRRLDDLARGVPA
jgi:putative Holliday junction resolvase